MRDSNTAKWKYLLPWRKNTEIDDYQNEASAQQTSTTRPGTDNYGERNTQVSIYNILMCKCSDLP